MERSNRAGRILLTAMLLLFSLELTGCCLFQKTESQYVLSEAKVKKISSGESAPYDGYILTNGALVKLLEGAEVCKAAKQ